MQPHPPHPTLHRREIQQRRPSKARRGIRNMVPHPRTEFGRALGADGDVFLPEPDAGGEDGEEARGLRVVGLFRGEGRGAEDAGEGVVVGEEGGDEARGVVLREERVRGFVLREPVRERGLDALAEGGQGDV